MGDELMKLLGRTHRNIDEAKDYLKKLAQASDKRSGGNEGRDHLQALYGAAVVGLRLMTAQRNWENSQGEAVDNLERLEDGSWKPLEDDER